MRAFAAFAFVCLVAGAASAADVHRPRPKPAHVADDLGDAVDFILDGGPAPLGLESTVIGFDGETPVLLRPGAIARDAIEGVCGPLRQAGDGIQSPGQMESHYAPNAALRLDVQTVQPGEMLLGFGPVDAALNLSPRGDLAEAAANLFAMLRQMDGRTDRIAVSPVPRHGLGEAINDRLQRAAAAR